MRCSLLFVLLMATSPVLAQWKIPEDAMLTRWGKQVTPENAWQEYPRPPVATRTELQESRLGQTSDNS